MGPSSVRALERSGRLWFPRISCVTAFNVSLSFRVSVRWRAKQKPAIQADAQMAGRHASHWGNQTAQIGKLRNVNRHPDAGHG